MGLSSQQRGDRPRSAILLLPESLRLTYQVLFKPFELNEELRKTGSYLATNVPVWGVRSGLSPEERRIVARALVAVVLGAILWPAVALLAMSPTGLGPRVDDVLWWANLLAAALAGLSMGVAGLLFVGISFGVSVGGAVSLAGSLAAVAGSARVLDWIGAGPTTLMPSAIAFGLGAGVCGMVLGFAAIAAFPLRPAARCFRTLCVLGGSLAVFAYSAGRDPGAVVGGIVLAVPFALGFLVGYFVGYRRLFPYVLELIWQVGLAGLGFLSFGLGGSGKLVYGLYRLSPAGCDELIWFRLLTLDRHLAWLALRGDRQFALEAIVEVARSFRQGWAAESALTIIMAHDLRGCKRIPDIAGVAALLSWFPQAIDLPSLDLRRTVTLMNEVSQNVEAATRALDGPGWPIHLRKAEGNLDALEETLEQMAERAARWLRPIVQCWQKTIGQALADVAKDTGPVLIENCYVWGVPIPPEHENVFVGREDLLAKIQENLAAMHKPTLVLYGQRRTGKTSLLLQLPNRLPADHVPVFVDLQKTPPVDGLSRFLYAMAREAVRQADRKRRIALPPVELEDFDRRGAIAFYDWLDHARLQLDGRLLLFTLDEFESIQEATERGRLEGAVLDVLRHLIQHHSSWLVLLFAGVRTLEQMGRNWHSYFISVRPLRVSYLDPEAARKLILLPAQSHPIRYDEQAVEAILKATSAQPFLVQAVCFELIQHLNSPRRRVAGPYGRVTLRDARQAIRQAVRRAHPYFYDLWANSSGPERLIQANLAYSQGGWARSGDLGKGLDPQAIHQAVQRLRQREILEREDKEYRFQVPMMRRWIGEEISLEAVRVASQSPSDVVRQRGRE